MRWKGGLEYIDGFKDNGRHGFGKRVYLANDQPNSCERHWSCGVCDELVRTMTLELWLTNEVRPTGYYELIKDAILARECTLPMTN